jgi:hypothetical protein
LAEGWKPASQVFVSDPSLRPVTDHYFFKEGSRNGG